MKIIIANQDRSADIGPDLKSAADALLSASTYAGITGQHQALSLRDAKNESEFLGRWIMLTRKKCHVSLERFDVPRGPGAMGLIMRFVHGLLWKLTRGQHERIVARQNFINSQFAAAIEFQQDEISRLRERVGESERDAGGAK